MNQLVTLGQVCAALIAILSFVGMLVKYAVVKPIKAYIDVMTYNIQPNSNGGSSLPDLHRNFNELKDLMERHIKEHNDIKENRIN